MAAWIHCKPCKHLTRKKDQGEREMEYCGHWKRYFTGKFMANPPECVNLPRAKKPRPTGLAVAQCKGCYRVDPRNGVCIAFDAPEKVWEEGVCWGKKTSLGVYLAGSINGHPDLDQPNEWRKKATEVLEVLGYKVLNPLRTPRPTTPEGVIKRDLDDIRSSDILLVEMNHQDKGYIGTAMEIRYAWERKKEIILWGTANQESFWLQVHATRRYTTLDQALEYLKKGEEVHARFIVNKQEDSHLFRWEMNC